MNVRGMGVVAAATTIVNRPEPVALRRDSACRRARSQRLADELMTMLTRAQERRCWSTTSPRRQDFALARRLRASSCIAVPLQRQDAVLGCLFALDKHDGEFDSVDSKLLNSIANESAIYLENAMLFEDVHGLMMGLLHSLTSAVDAKDAYTCGHSERVALLSRHLAAADRA